MRVTTAVLGCLLVWCTAASARPIGGAAPPTYWEPSRKPIGASDKAAIKTPDPFTVEEARPAIFYLPDKNGNLQPVLDFKYEDFEELYKLKNRLGRRVEPPRYVLQRMSAEGTVKEGRAELTVRFQILARDDDWVRVPLRLDQGLLRGDVQYKGSGRQFVDFEGEDAGYVCWIRGKSDAPHELVLSMLVPLDAAGDETRLKLFVPRAGASELKLSVPVAGAIGTVSDGAALWSFPSSEGRATEFRVARPAGDFQLAWSKPSPPGAETPAVLEAVGTLLARIDGRGVTTEAALSVKSLGAAFDRFTVRLPPDAELAAPADNAAGYAVAPISAAGEKGDTRRSVEVRLAKKTVGPVDVRLACRRDLEPIEGGPWIELAGFEVVSAARQWGTIAVAADGRRQALWGSNDRIRRIDSLPDALRKENALAGFEYFGQPFSLTVRPATQKTRIAVEPEYVLSIERDRVQLEGKLSYAIHGAEATALSVTIPGWRLDEVGPERFVAGDGVSVDGETATIPLIRPTSGPVELRLRAHRIIDRPDAPLTVLLPSPTADSVAPAALAVTAADNVELIPDERRIEGLSLQPGAPPMALPARRQTPLHYRCAAGRNVFAAEMRVHRRRIAVEAAGQITFADGAAAVQQQFSYVVLHEPAGYLTLDVPRELAAPGRIQVSMEGKPLPLIVAGDDRMTPISMRAMLPEARIGPCTLLLQYSVPSAEPSADRPASASVPLAMPAEGELASNTLTVKTAKNIRSRLRGDGWSAADGDVRGRLRLTASGPRPSIALDMVWEKDGETQTTAIDRALIQSRFTSEARQDRAVFQFTTDRQEIEMALPPGCAADEAVALVDGVASRPRRAADNCLSIPLGGRGESRRVTVELRYHFSDPRPPRGALDIEIPRLKSETWIRRTFLQLLLPVNEHLIAAPDGWTGEYAWGWNGGFWGRRQTIDQAELESWAGAAPLDPSIERANRYLFSSFGKPPRAAVRTEGRTWIVLWASGAALVFGLLLIYVPGGRRPATLLVAGLALSAAGLIAPEPTLLLVQAAALGLALALLGGLLERFVAGRRPVQPRKEQSGSRVVLGSVAPAPAEAPSSTGSIPPVVPPSTGKYAP